MSNLWPWLLVAGAGALHGLNPFGGWGLAVAAGLRAGGRWQALRALGPIALGHLASVALVAAAAVLGVSMGHGVLVGVALVVLAAGCLHGHRGAHRAPGRAGQAGLALGSFFLSTLHGAGLALVPALVPLCLAERAAGAGTATGSVSVSIPEPLWLALAAFALHTATMLLVSGAVAMVVCRAAASLRAGGVAGGISRHWAQRDLSCRLTAAACVRNAETTSPTQRTP